MPDPNAQHRQIAAEMFNHVWALLDKPQRSMAEDIEMIHAAHASRHHWNPVGGPKEFSIGEWQISRVYATLGRAEPAIYHARLSVDWAQRGQLSPFYLGYAHEALARGLALADDEAFEEELNRAEACTAQVTKPEDADALREDLATISTVKRSASSRM